MSEDPQNPSGALPGDPRFGLTKEELAVYYKNKSPSWICKGYFKPEGGLALREGAMGAHQAYLRKTRDQIRFTGPILQEDGKTPAGALALIDAPDKATAQSWMDNEGYTRAGAFEHVTVTRWSSSMELRWDTYPRTAGWQQFAITAFDAPDAKDRREAVFVPHHEFQATVMDRFVARGPMLEDDGVEMIGSFMIVEFPDLGACEEFWAAEPLNYGGVFEDVTIERWRYGDTLEYPG